MKSLGNAAWLLLFAAHLGAADVQPQKSGVLLLITDAQTAEGRAAIEKLKTDMAAQGVNVTEMSEDETSNLSQAGALNGGGPVIAVETHGGKPEFKVYDGASGADISKDFKASPPSAKEMPQPAVILKSEPVKTGKPASKASPVKESHPYKKNHIGLSIGLANLFDKNEDSLNMLADTNAGGRATSDANRGRFLLSYERTLSDKYSLGIMAGGEIGGSAKYERSGGNIHIEPEAKTATLYITRKFGRNFGFYAGGGADMYSFTVIDPVGFSGLYVSHSAFKGESTGVRAEAGFLLVIKNISLRLGVKQIFFGDPGDITSDFSGGGGYAPGKYKLIVRNGQTLDFKAVGQTLAANEKLFKTDFGGKAVTITLTYAFANW